MIEIDSDGLLILAPRALSWCKDAFASAGPVLERFAISNQLRGEHFLAQVLHESHALQRIEENLNYSSPSRIKAVWPRRFKTVEDAAPFARNPEGLANRVYGGRLGNTEPGDGWRFRGRGFLQVTGRTNYSTVGAALGLDLVADPDLVMHQSYAVAASAAIWEQLGCNVAADTDDVVRVSKLVNGGTVGLADRRAWLDKVRAIVR